VKKATILAGLLAFVCFLATAPGKTTAPGNADIAVSPFKGRIVVSNAKSNQGKGVVLEDPKIQRIGERYFLVGPSADPAETSAWLKGEVVWVPVDDILVIGEFDNIDEYKGRLKMVQAPAN
jgi:hypothetical protein